MNCRDVQHTIFADPDGPAPADQREAFDLHLAACPACRRLHRDLGEFFGTWRDVHANARIPDPALEWRRLELTLARPAPVKTRRSAAWVGFPAALAAAAIAWGVYLRNPSTSAQPVVAHAVAVAPAHTANVVVGLPARGAAADTTSSTVVFVDDKSGWTFVWDGAGRSI